MGLMGVAGGAQVFSKAADDWLDESRPRGRAKARRGNTDDQRRRPREGPEQKIGFCARSTLLNSNEWTSFKGLVCGRRWTMLARER